MSDHSAFSAAAATVLEHYFGSNAYGACATFAPRWSKLEPGVDPAEAVELCWGTFSSAAEEAGLSRLYGEVRFRQRSEAGLVMGQSIGEQAWGNFDGTAHAVLGVSGSSNQLSLGS